ncbi:hypothetical protein GM298_01370 [Enterobacter sp. HSTU-ASh6]|nr:hypothetical protein [Enterobacter sp. HSTU-ASh6]
MRLRVADVELIGDPIVIGNNGAKLIFLGTISNTAQSHNGDLYVEIQPHHSARLHDAYRRAK